jgi:hypothetical protein
VIVSVGQAPGGSVHPGLVRSHRFVVDAGPRDHLSGAAAEGVRLGLV